MPPHAAQVVETDIGRDLELQDRAALFEKTDQGLSLGPGKVRCIQPVPDPHIRHLLSRRERLPHAEQAVRDIVLQAVVLPGVDPHRKIGIRRRDPHDLVDHRRYVADIIELLADDIAARDVGIIDNALQRLQILPEVVAGLHLVLDDRQRNTADRREEPQNDACLFRDGGHDGVHLVQHRRGSLFFDQCRVGDLRV